jgi:hypothetical protein
MALMPAAEQHFRHRMGAVDENERGGIPRLQIRKSLVANGTREPLGSICHDTGFDHRVAHEQGFIALKAARENAYGAPISAAAAPSVQS